MRQVCTQPDERPIVKVRVVSGPQVLVHPMARAPQIPEINVVCQIMMVVRRGYEDEDWDPTVEGLQAVICGMDVREVPPIGTEVEAIVFDDYYNWVTPEKRVCRLAIRKYPTT